MAPKVVASKMIKATDHVKMGSMLDVEGFLKQHNNSETAKKIIKAFKDYGLLKYLTFDYQCV